MIGRTRYETKFRIAPTPFLVKRYDSIRLRAGRVTLGVIRPSVVNSINGAS